ncbi:MAG: nucleoside monophosphate kinase [Candidatus Komeilibacteria bacterium]|nr:nucleoside monophosphate kinase [Candidatus Komeilibacteria bacterium]
MNNGKSIIIILGPQGSGKGTQGKKLMEKLSLPYLEAGQLLRDEIASGSEEGKYISSIIDKGELLPDEFMNKFMASKIADAVQKSGGVIADGYPRRLGQAQSFDRAAKPTHVLLIDIPDKESVRRLSARRQCPKDKRIYNLITNPPRQGEVCDDCGTKLIGRVDDAPAAIQERLNLYHGETEPIIAYYEAQGILHKIDGTPDITAVEAAVWKIFT